MTEVSKKISKNPVVWSLVVCFFPDENLLMNLVSRLSGQVSKILLLNNGGMSSEFQKNILKVNAVLLHDLQGNSGIAKALNEGFLQAIAQGADFVVTFDQDSSPELDHVAGLIKHWLELSSVSEVSEKVGAIGPSFYDVRSGYFSYPFYRASGLRVIKQYSPENNDGTAKADALITSGMLVPVAMWRDNLKFNELLFIDFVDTEWCFRSKTLGYVNYGCFDVKMKHELSEASPIVFFGIIILKYSPLRRYYHFRNCLYLASRSYVPFAFRIRLVAGLFLRLFTAPFVDDHPYSSLRNIAAGVFDAVRGHYGKKSVPESRLRQ
jgi:rhamnosyltransferase